MKKIDYKNKNSAELNHDLSASQEKLRLFRFGLSGSKSKNVKEGKMLKRDIARIHTALKAASNAK